MYFTKGNIKKKIINNSFTLTLKKNKNQGSVINFLGVVRADKHKSKTVKKIIYESYSEMAEKVFEKLIQQIKKKYRLNYVFLKHSIGVVKAGEVSLLITLSSKHRSEGLVAMKELISLLKKEVPIFKKEILSDNSYIWSGSKSIKTQAVNQFS